MDLKQYKLKIRKQLLGGLKDQAIKQEAIEAGEYKPPHKGGGIRRKHYKIPQEDYDELIRKLSTYQGQKIDMSHPSMGGSIFDSVDPTNFGGSMVHDREMPRITAKKAKAIMNKIQKHDMVQEGGRFNFIKSLENVGKTAVHDLSKTASTVKDVALKTGATLAGQQVGNYAYNSLKNVGKSLMSAAPEIESGLEASAPVLEETAPLLLAAGIRPRRTRNVSQKEKNRHALIRQLMHKHNCTLAQASKFIKQNNLQY